MHPEIKICGLKTEPALNAALNGGASHVGFIFFPKSPRNIDPQAAGRLRDAARGRAKTVAVTVDADDSLLDRIMREMQPDMMQLHGKETPGRVGDVKRRLGLPVIKALSVSTAEDITRARDYASIADRILFDAKPPKNAELPGGNGITFDWSLLRGVSAELDYFLSGGLNAGNVAEALRIARPAAIDISSGVESAPGVKDVELIRGFFEAVNKARAA